MRPTDLQGYPTCLRTSSEKNNGVCERATATNPEQWVRAPVDGEHVNDATIRRKNQPLPDREAAVEPGDPKQRAGEAEEGDPCLQDEGDEEYSAVQVRYDGKMVGAKGGGHGNGNADQVQGTQGGAEGGRGTGGKLPKYRNPRA